MMKRLAPGMTVQSSPGSNRALWFAYCTVCHWESENKTCFERAVKTARAVRQHTCEQVSQHDAR